MKRLPLIALVGTAVFFVCLIFYRAKTGKGVAFEKPTKDQVTQATQITEICSKIETPVIKLEDFLKVVRMRAGTNLGVLSKTQIEKLFACVNRFYACYSSDDFEGYKKFRLQPPFTVGKALEASIIKIANSRGLKLKTPGDVMRLAWSEYNNTNKIGGVNEKSIRVAASVRRDLGEPLRHSAFSKSWPELNTASCWEGAAVYEPDPANILKKEGELRFFTLEFFARFYPQLVGPASPLVLVCYWDSNQEDWMPYALCSMFDAGSYDTIF